MKTVRSNDGTAIAYETSGEGPPLILVDGAMCYREIGSSRKFAKELAEHFTVYTYDRRGRGGSGDTGPYSVEREVEDIGALIAEAGRPAYLCGFSSGAPLALDAAQAGLPVAGVAMYEPPFIVDDSRPRLPADYLSRLNALIAEDRRGDAVRLFMKQVGLPGALIALMRFMPAWGKMKAIAHTLAYDAEIMGETQSGRPLPAERWSRVTTPTCVIAGGKSPVFFHTGTRALADMLPTGEHRVLEGQTHMVKAKVLSPLLIELFAGRTASAPAGAPVGRTGAAGVA